MFQVPAVSFSVPKASRLFRPCPSAERAAGPGGYDGRESLAGASELAGLHPQIAFIALGLPEQSSQIILAGTSGFAGYVARDASIATLIGAMVDATAGRLSCSGEVASQLLRALFQQTQGRTAHSGGSPEESLEGLTRRERDIAHLVSQGYSNKEIARDLSLSLGTVKHHVHHVLGKLQVNRRARVPVRLSPQSGAVLSLRGQRLTSTATKP